VPVPVPRAHPPTVREDGRLARGGRARAALAEALLELVAEGDLQPTSKRVAERAGVSPRLVFHHFQDMEAVLQRAASIQLEKQMSTITPLPNSGPLSERIRLVVERRSRIFEEISPVRRAVNLAAHNSETLREGLELGRNLLHQGLEHAFALELEKLENESRRRILDALDVAGSWETWEQLRDLGREPDDASRTMALLFWTILNVDADEIERATEIVDSMAHDHRATDQTRGN